MHSIPVRIFGHILPTGTHLNKWPFRRLLSPPRNGQSGQGSTLSYHVLILIIQHPKLQYGMLLSQFNISSGLEYVENPMGGGEGMAFKDTLNSLSNIQGSSMIYQTLNTLKFSPGFVLINASPRIRTNKCM